MASLGHSDLKLPTTILKESSGNFHQSSVPHNSSFGCIKHKIFSLLKASDLIKKHPHELGKETKNMVHTGSDESKLRTFQRPPQDQIPGYKDFYGEFQNADI